MDSFGIVRTSTFLDIINRHVWLWSPEGFITSRRAGQLGRTVGIPEVQLCVCVSVRLCVCVCVGSSVHIVYFVCSVGWLGEWVRGAWMVQPVIEWVCKLWQHALATQWLRGWLGKRVCGGRAGQSVSQNNDWEDVWVDGLAFESASAVSVLGPAGD